VLTQRQTDGHTNRLDRVSSSMACCLRETAPIHSHHLRCISSHQCRPSQSETNCGNLYGCTAGHVSARTSDKRTKRLNCYYLRLAQVLSACVSASSLQENARGRRIAPSSVEYCNSQRSSAGEWLVGWPAFIIQQKRLNSSRRLQPSARQRNHLLRTVWHLGPWHPALFDIRISNTHYWIRNQVLAEQSYHPCGATSTTLDHVRLIWRRDGIMD